MSKPGPPSDPQKILKIWNDEDPNNWYIELPFSKIIEKSNTQLNLKKRTAINYLNKLVDDKILEKRVNNKRQTFYKPISDLAHSKTLLIDLIDNIESSELLRLLHKFLFLYIVSLKNFSVINPRERLDVLKTTVAKIIDVEEIQTGLDEAINSINRSARERDKMLSVLSTVKEDVDEPTRIMYATNLSWNPLNEVLRSLVKQKLLIEIEVPGIKRSRLGETNT